MRPVRIFRQSVFQAVNAMAISRQAFCDLSNIRFALFTNTTAASYIWPLDPLTGINAVAGRTCDRSRRSREFQPVPQCIRQLAFRIDASGSSRLVTASESLIESRRVWIVSSISEFGV